jgi:glycosyltransferase involved in cell wall biosynthesis
LKKKSKTQNVIIHDYLQNFGGGERLIKILLSKRFHKLIVGYDNKIFNKFFLKKKKLKKLFNFKTPNIIKKFFLIYKFSNLSVVSKNCLCSGNYSLFANLNAKNKIVYIHSVPKIFFRRKYFYSRFSLKAFLANAIFFNFRKNYINKLESFDFLIANSFFTKKQLHRFTKKKIHVIHPPIEKFKYNKKVKFSDYYIFNNRHEIEKNLIEVLHAFRYLKNQKLIVLSIGSLTNYLKNQFYDCKNIKFKGLVSNSKYVEYLANCKAVINVSNDEDFGMGAIEPMQFGKITLCLNQGGYKETTKNYFNAIHIDDKDISGHLIKTITKIDIKLLKRLRKNSLITFKKYSQKNFEDKINNFII